MICLEPKYGHQDPRLGKVYGERVGSRSLTCEEHTRTSKREQRIKERQHIRGQNFVSAEAGSPRILSKKPQGLLVSKRHTIENTPGISTEFLGGIFL